MDENADDLIRGLILEFLYNQSLKAKSVSQRRCALPPISRHIERQGYSKERAVHNLGYLIDAGWVKKESESSTHLGFSGTRRKSIKIKTDYYRISDKGINQFEQDSKYRKKTAVGISITNIGGVTIVGDNNYVQTSQQELYQVLDEIKTLVLQIDPVNDEKKLELKSDIETIQAQLAKKNPVKDIIRLAWSSLGPLATIDGAISLYQRAESLIQKLLQ